MAQAVLGDDRDEERFIRILAWASFTGARRFTQIVATKTAAGLPAGKPGVTTFNHPVANALAA